MCPGSLTFRMEKRQKGQERYDYRRNALPAWGIVPPGVSPTQQTQGARILSKYSQEEISRNYSTVVLTAASPPIAVQPGWSQSPGKRLSHVPESCTDFQRPAAQTQRQHCHPSDFPLHMYFLKIDLRREKNSRADCKINPLQEAFIPTTKLCFGLRSQERSHRPFLVGPLVTKFSSGIKLVHDLENTLERPGFKQ